MSGYVWLLLGSVWLCLALSGSAWLLLGSVWLCLALPGAAWLPRCLLACLPASLVSFPGPVPSPEVLLGRSGPPGHLCYKNVKIVTLLFAYLCRFCVRGSRSVEPDRTSAPSDGFVLTKISGTHREEGQWGGPTENPSLRLRVPPLSAHLQTTLARSFAQHLFSLCLGRAVSLPMLRSTSGCAGACRTDRGHSGRTPEGLRKDSGRTPEAPS